MPVHSVELTNLLWLLLQLRLLNWHLLLIFPPVEFQLSQIDKACWHCVGMRVDADSLRLVTAEPLRRYGVWYHTLAPRDAKLNDRHYHPGIWSHWLSQLKQTNRLATMKWAGVNFFRHMPAAVKRHHRKKEVWSQKSRPNREKDEWNWTELKVVCGMKWCLMSCHKRFPRRSIHNLICFLLLLVLLYSATQFLSFSQSRIHRTLNLWRATQLWQFNVPCAYFSSFLFHRIHFAFVAVC